MDLWQDCLQAQPSRAGWTPPTCDRNLQVVTVWVLVAPRTRVGPGMFSGHWAKGEGVDMVSLELGQSLPMSFEQSEYLKWRTGVTTKSHSLS